jgi:hypothetical protein
MFAAAEELCDTALRQRSVFFGWSLCPNKYAVDSSGAAVEASRRFGVKTVGDGVLSRMVGWIFQDEISTLVDCIEDDPNAFGYVCSTNAKG